MSFIPFEAADLTAMQADVSASLTDTCSTTRDVETGTIGGPPTVTPTAVLTNVPCKLRTTGRELIVNDQMMPFIGRMQDTQTFDMRIAVGTDIKLLDVVTVNGRTFTVLGTDAGKTHALVMHVLLREYTL